MLRQALRDRLIFDHPPRLGLELVDGIPKDAVHAMINDLAQTCLADDKACTSGCHGFDRGDAEVLETNGIDFFILAVSARMPINGSLAIEVFEFCKRDVGV